MKTTTLLGVQVPVGEPFVIGTEFRTGKTIVLRVLDGPRCGYDCPCCEYPDGTAPVDHDRDCDIVTNRDGDWSDCTCEGAEARAAERKKEEEE